MDDVISVLFAAACLTTFLTTSNTLILLWRIDDLEDKLKEKSNDTPTIRP